MSASKTAATVPAHRIGTAYFRSIEGQMVGLHIKNPNVFVISVTQEPLNMAIGSFRFQRLSAVTNSTAAHLPTIAEEFVRAFDSGPADAVSIAVGPDMSADGIVAATDESPRGKAGQRLAITGNNAMDGQDEFAPTVVVRFSCFGLDHSVSLNLHPCDTENRDGFVWSIMQDMYRVILRQSGLLVAAERQRAHHQQQQARTSPPRDRLAHTAPTRPQTAGVSATAIASAKDTSHKAQTLPSGIESTTIQTTSGHPLSPGGQVTASKQPNLANSMERSVRNRRQEIRNSRWRPVNRPKPHLIVRNPTDEEAVQQQPEVTDPMADPSQRPPHLPTPLYSQPRKVEPVGPQRVSRSAGGGWHPDPHRGKPSTALRRGRPSEWSSDLMRPKGELQQGLLEAHARIAELEARGTSKTVLPVASDMHVTPRSPTPPSRPSSAASTKKHNDLVHRMVEFGKARAPERAPGGTLRAVPKVNFSGDSLDYPMEYAPEAH